MRIKMAFLIIGLIFNLLLNLNIAYALQNIKVSSLGPVIKSGNTTIQNISLRFNTDSSWQILVTPLENCLKNSYQQKITIPLDRLSIENNNGQQLNLLNPNKPIILDSDNETGHINKNYILRCKNSDADYPGIYTASLQFILLTNSGTELAIYPISIEQYPEQKITTASNTVNLNINSNNLLKKGFTQELERPIRLYVRSNTGWKLILKNYNYNDLIKVNFKVLSVPENCKTNYSSDYFKIPNSSLVIAKGTPTFAASKKELETKIIEINYQIKTQDGKILPAGSFQFDFDYDLIPDLNENKEAL